MAPDVGLGPTTCRLTAGCSTNWANWAIMAPDVGLGPTTYRLTAGCSTNWANQAKITKKTAISSTQGRITVYPRYHPYYYILLYNHSLFFWTCNGNGSQSDLFYFKNFDKQLRGVIHISHIVSFHHSNSL